MKPYCQKKWQHNLSSHHIVSYKHTHSHNFHLFMYLFIKQYIAREKQQTYYKISSIKLSIVIAFDANPNNQLQYSLLCGLNVTVVK